jgi:hypothetical protein
MSDSLFYNNIKCFVSYEYNDFIISFPSWLDCLLISVCKNKGLYRVIYMYLILLYINLCKMSDLCKQILLILGRILTHGCQSLETGFYGIPRPNQTRVSSPGFASIPDFDWRFVQCAWPIRAYLLAQNSSEVRILGIQVS